VTRELFLPLLLLVPLLVGCLSFHRGPMAGEPSDARFTEVDGVRVRYVDTEAGPAAQPRPTPLAPIPADAPEGPAMADVPADPAEIPTESTEGPRPAPPAPPPLAERPTVVLLHGFASALDVWQALIPALEKTHRVIALDLKGFGWTERPPGDYSPEAQARLVLRLLEQRGVGRAAFVAHSWGSSVALAAAMLAPERVTRIALYDAWVYEEQLPTFFHWARADGVGEALFGLYYKQRADERMALAFYDRKYVTEALVEDVEAALERPGTLAAALAAVRGQRYAEVQDRYRTIAAPTLLMWGREDVVTPLRYGERLVRDLPQARLVTYARCGHFPMIEARAASTRELLHFLNREEAP
jgi:pimeloyl-ACP methyl ester carboxylesterase